MMLLGFGAIGYSLRSCSSVGIRQFRHHSQLRSARPGGRAKSEPQRGCLSHADAAQFLR